MNRVRQQLSDDTEVFVLLVHYYHTVNLKNHVTVIAFFYNFFKIFFITFFRFYFHCVYYVYVRMFVCLSAVVAAHVANKDKD